MQVVLGEIQGCFGQENAAAQPSAQPIPARREYPSTADATAGNGIVAEAEVSVLHVEELPAERKAPVLARTSASRTNVPKSRCP